ncbi:hypothetical protein AK830_g9305 [Neonectria ditissima]|uniref:D-xylose 1-dehydrogenase (NADP(+), D-xylono-1,5-lactone-forming) n=1 Tax=Neonectria ditissima TaxID=78410 RepID=A0A0P7BA49_9HYPO|nr:hypothetical protein AK830_g9305 [Neonectria ditissima]
MAAPREIRWGILATGAISITFTKDLLVDPKTRGVDNVKHTVVAAASSTSKARAESFLKDVGAPDAKAYGSYEELVQDPNIEIIYVATPHSHHYQNVRLCLEAGKHVLCEKAFTVNAKQARLLVDKAEEKGLFLMEAFWTRYFPLTNYVRDVIKSGKLGTIYRVFSDASVGLSPETSFSDGKHRMVNADLAGGALLDLGVYSLTWPFLVFWQTQDQKTPPKVLSSMTKYKGTSADESTTMLLTFPREASAGGDAHAVATTSIRVGNVPNDDTPQPCVRIQGELGELQLFPVAQCPKTTKLILKDGGIEEKTWAQPGPGKGSGWFNGFLHFMNPEGEGQGMFWEADEAALAIIEGRKEGRNMDLKETIAVMEVMDEVRRQGGLVYPEKIETVEYPVAR